jgi:serine phosphatase RsbU (regulator of sigma subunit)
VRTRTTSIVRPEHEDGDRASDLHFAILDGMGHGIGSTLLTGLAVGAYRHARRDGAPVAGIHTAIDQALVEYFGDDSFATGIIARLATGPGRLEWSRAGHPRPLRWEAEITPESQRARLPASTG